MTVPAWLLDVFAAIMLLVAAVSAARLVVSRRAVSGRDGRPAGPDADIDVSHLLMGMAMAGTLTASLSTLPSAAWQVIFGVLTVWFGYRVVREFRGGRGLRALVSEHHAPHLLHSAAMLYMFLALRMAASRGASSAMAGMSGSSAGLRLPTLALLFAFLLCGYVVADLDRIPAPRAFTRLRLPAPAPALATAGAPASPAATTAATATKTSAITPTSPAPTSSTSPPGPALSGLLSPSVARGGRIAMGVTMAFMLIIMIQPPGYPEQDSALLRGQAPDEVRLRVNGAAA